MVLLEDILLQVPKTLLLRERQSVPLLILKVQLMLAIILLVVIQLQIPSLVLSLLLISPLRLTHSLVSQEIRQFKQLT
jgi:hypothetical protein